MIHRCTFVLAALCVLLPACGGGGMAPPGATPDFTLGVSPGTITATAGSNSTATVVSVSGLNGFSGNVIVSITGLPQGATTAPAQPFAVAASSSQMLTVFVPASTAPGNIALTLTGASGLRNHSAALVLSVQPGPIADFSLETAGKLAIVPGSSRTVDITVAAGDGFNQSVLLRLENLPPGMTTTPALPFFLPPGRTAQVTIHVPADAVSRSIALTWFAETGELRHSAPMVLDVPSRGNP